MSSPAPRPRGPYSPLSLLFIDLDSLKINDLYGHSVGEQVLREIGWLLDSQQDPGESIGWSNAFARYGGEELALIPPATSMDGAFSTAERLHNRVTTVPMLPELAARRTPPPSHMYPGRHISIPASVPSKLVVAADVAVYVAKRAGTNCVRMASSAVPPSSLSSPLVRY